ncbi:hypothetical protein NP233_g8621 [Leucocoprinus birnbaumii]|uniref:NmrA-like domain-containing protein n=1 Tax=Leucocoprinus birnbaumii TaxID=56174 RepID=A0AAD5VM76_9AGAR|nr:hypothetical protein NP233_g8621 [Leucocoprinus birnbaumii]
MPIKVAVAGVTNGLGHSIVSALLNTTGVEVTLLTRSSSTPVDLSHFTSLGAIVKPVDYSSIPDLTTALEGVQTVISTIFSKHDIQPILNLITASKSAGVRRFAPSDFAFSAAANDRLALYEPKRKVHDALKASGLEYTTFANGIFTDYLSFGAPKSYEGKLHIYPVVVNIAAGKATIPGTGDEKLTLTTIADVGRFVAGAVKLEGRWPEELGMVGETTSYNQVVRDVESVTGKKLEVEYLDKEKIAKALEVTKGDEIKFFYTQALGVIAGGLGAVEPTLNRLATQVATTSVKDFVIEYWST